MLKLGTINQIVEAILAEYKGDAEAEAINMIANEATIYFKTALICESRGIDEAMKYFKGFHRQDEYKEFLTQVVDPRDLEKGQKDKNEN